MFLSYFVFSGLYFAVLMSALCIALVGTLQDLYPYNAVLYLRPVLCRVSARSSVLYSVQSLYHSVSYLYHHYHVLLVLVFCAVQFSVHFPYSVRLCIVHVYPLLSSIYVQKLHFMSILRGLLFSCLFMWSSIFMSVLRGLLLLCLYSLVFYLHVCTPWSSI